MKQQIRALWAFVVALFSAQPIREFRIDYIGLLQAKSGTITSGGGSNAALESAVAQSSPKVATLAQTAVDALTESADPKIITLSTANRKVRVLGAATNQANLDTAAATGGMALTSTLTKDDATKASSTFHATNTLNDGDFENAIDDSNNQAGGLGIVSITRPKMSVGSLLSALEDVAATQNKDMIAVLDQVSDNIRVFVGPAGQGAAADAAIAAAFVEEAVFTQTLTAGAERMLGE